MRQHNRAIHLRAAFITRQVFPVVDFVVMLRAQRGSQVRRRFLAHAAVAVAVRNLHAMPTAEHAAFERCDGGKPTTIG